MSDTELAVKKLIIEALKLEDITPAEIDSDEPLFGSGLGLDSIDALELGVAIRRQYGIRFETVNDEVKAHFANVRSLARFIESQRGG
ncbi:MAG TPA: phosphopantetheine-binding protein [Hypericibacter adhaerens]|jgi:acyl carrier protein|uniref:Acyl carrier protein n=1 Tax=Hypericibacter adhaerens TaxID=2602016 RepID=A0A5J6MYY2_9PROT|nr:phosphopantetheine-binding protein [Hypericibacter adhaerens]QEX23002.1 acyl carrier protein [Hypericibacter adhaerens]HWA44266.1 phosphopantetheine-binding protein [Hypericibacter adhaerens]